MNVFFIYPSKIEEVLCALGRKKNRHESKYDHTHPHVFILHLSLFPRYVTSYKAQEKMKSGERTVRMSIVDEDSEYMAGHVVDGKN